MTQDYCRTLTSSVDLAAALSEAAAALYSRGNTRFVPPDANDLGPPQREKQRYTSNLPGTSPAL